MCYLTMSYRLIFFFIKDGEKKVKGFLYGQWSDCTIGLVRVITESVKSQYASFF